MEAEGYAPLKNDSAAWKSIVYVDDASFKHEAGHALSNEMVSTRNGIKGGRDIIKEMFQRGSHVIPLKKEMLSFYHYQRSNKFIDWDHPELKKHLEESELGHYAWRHLGLQHPRVYDKKKERELLYQAWEVPEEFFVEFLGEFLTRPEFLAEHYPEIYKFLQGVLPQQKLVNGKKFLDYLKDHPNMSKHIPLPPPLPPALPDIAASALKKAAPLAMPTADGVGLPAISKPKKAPKHSDDKSYWDIFLEYLPFLDFFSEEKHATGGYLRGPSHAQGGIDLGVLGGVRHEAEGGEYIIRKEAVQRLGIGTLDHMNEHGNLPRNRRFGDGGPSADTNLSSWPYGTSTPYLQMGADWTQVLGPKPDTSDAEAQMREEM